MPKIHIDCIEYDLQVPYMKANDVWFTVCQGFVFSVLLEYTLVNFFLGRHPKSKKTATMESSTSETSKMGMFVSWFAGIVGSTEYIKRTFFAALNTSTRIRCCSDKNAIYQR